MPTLHPLATLQHGEYSRHVTLAPMKWQNDATNKLQDFFWYHKANISISSDEVRVFAPEKA